MKRKAEPLENELIKKANVTESGNAFVDALLARGPEAFNSMFSQEKEEFDEIDALLARGPEAFSSMSSQEMEEFDETEFLRVLKETKAAVGPIFRVRENLFFAVTDVWNRMIDWTLASGFDPSENCNLFELDSEVDYDTLKFTTILLELISTDFDDLRETKANELPLSPECFEKIYNLIWLLNLRTYKSKTKTDFLEMVKENYPVFYEGLTFTLGHQHVNIGHMALLALVEMSRDDYEYSHFIQSLVMRVFGAQAVPVYEFSGFLSFLTGSYGKIADHFIALHALPSIHRMVDSMTETDGLLSMFATIIKNLFSIQMTSYIIRPEVLTTLSDFRTDLETVLQESAFSHPPRPLDILLEKFHASRLQSNFQFRVSVSNTTLTCDSLRFRILHTKDQVPDRYKHEYQTFLNFGTEKVHEFKLKNGHLDVLRMITKVAAFFESLPDNFYVRLDRQIFTEKFFPLHVPLEVPLMKDGLAYEYRLKVVGHVECERDGFFNTIVRDDSNYWVRYKESSYERFTYNEVEHIFLNFAHTLIYVKTESSEE